MSREQIEEEIMKCNEQHLKQAHSSIAHQDKTHKKLRNNSTRDKILNGTLQRSECDDERVHEFLKLLKVPRGQNRNRIKEITEEEWISVVKRSKKRSASSIFSKRTYAVHKCALGVDRMTHVLVTFYNILIKNEHYPKRWLMMLDAMLGKGKGWIIGKLRIVTLIEADLQFRMRMKLGSKNKEIIEDDERFSKANYGSRKNYSIE